MSKTGGEIGSQPACWRRAAALAAEPDTQNALPPAGAEVAVAGCSTSLFSAQAYAALVLAQRFAVAEAGRRGLDPDQPRNLKRSVILPPGQVTP